MATKVYTLRKKKDTEELHLFEGDMKPDGTCTAGHKSVCQKMSFSEGTTNTFGCKSENEARLGCAQAGRAACGTCVSHLYTTY